MHWKGFYKFVKAYDAKIYLSERDDGAVLGTVDGLPPEGVTWFCLGFSEFIVSN